MMGKPDGSDAADHFTESLLIAVSNVGAANTIYRVGKVPPRRF